MKPFKFSKDLEIPAPIAMTGILAVTLIFISPFVILNRKRK